MNLRHLFLLYLYFLLSCDKEHKLLPYQATSIENLKLKDLYRRALNSDSPLKDTVILVVQGGPMSNLVSSEDVIEFIFPKPINLYNSNYDILQVHQSQTLNNLHQQNLNFEQAIKEAKISVNILYRVASEIKAKNKTVIIWGFSYGSLIIADFIANKEHKFDKAFLGGGRLNIPEDIWKSFANGTPKGYENDGVTIKNISISKYENSISLLKIAAGLGNNRYTDLLKNINLDKTKIMFYFGGKDEYVGKISQKEIDFLKNKNANYIIDYDIGHNISQETKYKVLKFFKNL